MASCSKEPQEDIAVQRVQQFVENISNYAKSQKPGFLIIPQNGVELAFNNTDTSDGVNFSYLAAVDGFGTEELFYNGELSPDIERLAMLRKLKATKKILVSEYVTGAANIPDAYQRNRDEGFTAFVRNASNYYYTQIPSVVPNENANNITGLSNVQNYLYLISADNFSSKAQMLNAIAATNFDLVLVDLCYNNIELTPAEVEQLKHKANGGRRLAICYINVGAAENFRYYWGSNWGIGNPPWIKKKYSGYNDEYWVEFWNPEWQQIIYGNDQSYIKKIVDAGFDGAYLDNVEAYYFLYNE